MATPYISRLSLLLIFTLSGCSLSQPEEESVQKLLFEINFTQGNWGPPYNGYYIDSEGGLYRFQYAAADEPWEPGSTERFTEQELQEKYAHNRTSLGTINAGTLSNMIQLIDAAAQGPYCDEGLISENGIIMSYIAYRFEPETQAYTPVMLWVLGNGGLRNLSDGAVDLSEWLAQVTGAPYEPWPKEGC